MPRLSLRVVPVRMLTEGRR